MKLWLLRPNESDNGAWKPWYDKAFGFVVRAESEADARALADDGAGDENRDHNHPWLTPEESTCIELAPDGPFEVVIRDYRSA